jgi:hypothetical protein
MLLGPGAGRRPRVGRRDECVQRVPPFQVVGNDLYYMKTRDTGTGVVEVHPATGASGYAASGLDVPTRFTMTDPADGQ